MYNTKMETCVVCGKETNVAVTTDVEYRYGYIEGAGQLCYFCYADNIEEGVMVDKNTILNTPNDAELGAKVRMMHHQRVF